jgi:ribosomal protein L37AE/L43A
VPRTLVRYGLISLRRHVDKLVVSRVIYGRGDFMPACPNCGRETQRTADWACQWCGYPLLSRAYKQIEKTYKELQEERRSALSPVAPEPEAEPEKAPEPEPEPEPVPEPEPEKAPEPEPEEASEPEKAPEPEAAPEPEETPEAEPEPEPEKAPEPEPAPEPAPKPKPAAKRQGTPGVTEISVEELNVIFLRDKLEAHAALKDKTLRVTGVVEKVFVRDHLDVRYIILASTKKSHVWSVRCVFDQENMSQLRGLAKGQAAVVQGKYDGYSKNIILKECVLA